MLSDLIQGYGFRGQAFDGSGQESGRGKVLKSFCEEKTIPQDLISDESKHGHGAKARASSPKM